MHRSILTGLFVFSFSAAGTFGIADAQTAAPPASRTAIVVTHATSALPATTDGGDPVASPGAADLVTSNVAPVDAADSSARSTKHLGRLRRFASGIVTRSSAIASSLTRSAMRFIGSPYVYGGTRATGFDCSGYVQHVFALMGVRLPRTADAQFDAGRHIRAALIPGDLVFFHTYAQGVSHVGIYLGHNTFIHSSSSRGVAVSSLHDRYWAPRYVGAKRVVGT